MIIAISGPSGSGKDTIANFFTQNYNFKQVSFAGPLYEEVVEGYGIEKEVLTNRATKETRIPELALINCKEVGFVALMVDIFLADYDGTLFNFLKEPRSPRFILQQWGTEYRRKEPGFGYDAYWVDKALAVLKEHPRSVISDLRFSNEVEVLKGLGSKFIYVDPGKRVPSVISHSSETRLNFGGEEILVDNSGTLETLNSQFPEIAKLLVPDLV